MQPPPGIGATVTADFLFFHARYVRAERAQLLFKVFIAAVDVFYVVYLASALRRKRSHYQRRARAQIACVKRRAEQLFNAFHHCRAVVYNYVRAHALKLANVVEAVFKYVFNNKAVALCTGKVCHHGLLKVCREARIRQSFYIHSARPVFAAYAHEEFAPVIPVNHMRAAFHKLCGYGLKMRWDYVVYNNVSAGRRGGYHVCSGLYLVGDYGICAAVQLSAAGYADNVRACALHLRAHHVKEVRRVNNVRLLCGV